MSALEIAICGVAILIGVGVKAVTGMGFPLIAIPAISLFVSVEDAVAVVAMPNVTMNAVLCWRTRGEVTHTRDLPILSVTGVLGAIAGTVLLATVAESVLMIGLAAAVFAYVAYAAASPQRSLPEETTRRWSPAVGLVAGVMQGAVGVSGPPVAAWMHAYHLPPRAFVFSVSLFFFLAGAAQLAVLLANGMIYGPRLLLGLAAIPLVLAMIPLGERLRDRLDARRFDRVVLALLLASGASLLVRALA